MIIGALRLRLYFRKENKSGFDIRVNGLIVAAAFLSLGYMNAADRYGFWPYAEGVLKCFYRSGNVKSAIFYIGGKKNGLYREFSPEGTVSYEGSFRNDQKEGRHIFFNKEERVVREESYEDDQLKGYTTYQWDYKLFTKYLEHLKTRETFENGKRIKYVYCRHYFGCRMTEYLYGGDPVGYRYYDEGGDLIEYFSLEPDGSGKLLIWDRGLFWAQNMKKGKVAWVKMCYSNRRKCQWEKSNWISWNRSDQVRCKDYLEEGTDIAVKKCPKWKCRVIKFK